jgi:excisionase family DNA binding protein
MSDIPQIYTLAEVADLIKASQTTIRRLCRAKKIGFFKVGDGYRFTAKHVIQYINREVK